MEGIINRKVTVSIISVWQYYYQIPLTTEEVLLARNNVVWRRTRFCLVLMFWAIMAMFLSIVTCLVTSMPRCKTCDTLERVPSVPPVHMSFAPLISRLNNDQVYTM